MWVPPTLARYCGGGSGGMGSYLPPVTKPRRALDTGALLAPGEPIGQVPSHQNSESGILPRKKIQKPNDQSPNNQTSWTQKNPRPKYTTKNSAPVNLRVKLQKTVNLRAVKWQRSDRRAKTTHHLILSIGMPNKKAKQESLGGSPRVLEA